MVKVNQVNKNLGPFILLCIIVISSVILSCPSSSVDRSGGGGPELGEGAPRRNNEQNQSRVDIILTLARNTRNDVDTIDIKLRGEYI